MRLYLTIILLTLECSIISGCATSSQPIKIGSPELNAMYSSMFGISAEDILFQAEAECFQFSIETKESDRWGWCYVVEDALGLRIIRYDYLEYEPLVSCGYTDLIGYALDSNLLGHERIQVHLQQHGIELNMYNRQRFPDNKISRHFIHNLNNANVKEVPSANITRPSAYGDKPLWWYFILNPFK